MNIPIKTAPMMASMDMITSENTNTMNRVKISWKEITPVNINKIKIPPKTRPLDIMNIDRGILRIFILLNLI